MKLHVITYTTDNDKGVVNNREFAPSGDAASKRCTELKKNKDLDGKPERSEVEIPTDKAGLIAWLNKNASVVAS